MIGILITVKILNFEVFNEGLLLFEINEDTTVYDILMKMEEKYGDLYEKKVGQKLINDINTNYRIFLNSNYLEASMIVKQRVKNEDHILILKPISGGK